MSSSNTPCAACKCSRRKCTQECVFAPYFPSDDPQKFVYVHRVFGASNVAKLLNELNVTQRNDAVRSLAYEAEARLRDPVYGCVGLISLLQHQLKQVQSEIEIAKKELANYIGPQAMMTSPTTTHGFMHQQQQQHLGNPSSSTQVMNMMPMMAMNMGMGIENPLMIRETQQQQQQNQQIYEAQQFAALAAAREQEMIRAAYNQQQNQDLVRFNNGGGGGMEVGGASSVVTATGLNQINPSLALGTFDSTTTSYDQQIQEHHHHHHHIQAQQLLINTNQQNQQIQQQHRSDGSEEGRSVAL